MSSSSMVLPSETTAVVPVWAPDKVILMALVPLPVMSTRSFRLESIWILSLPLASKSLIVLVWLPCSWSTVK